MLQTTKKKWNFAVDRGGTFTDIIGVDPSNKYHTLKILSNSPEYSNPSIEGIKRILHKNSINKLNSDIVKSIRFGTTVATNALLERKGGNLSLIITRGLGDLLEIGYQARPHLFDLEIIKPSLLYSEVFELEERINKDGLILKPFNIDNFKVILEKIRQNKPEAVSVVLMHSWINPDHELLCEKLLLESGIKNIYLSHKTVNQIKIVSRGNSTLVDAYLSPVMTNYLENIQSEVEGIKIEFIQSSGNLRGAENFKGKDAILSGPAGGVVAVGKLSEELALKGAIGFDMGGTSTDVSRYDGKFEKIYEQNIEGIELQRESLDIITVAAGGGSILWYDGQKFRVGPQSAGSNPGPACYGFGGPVTITDANLLTGRLCADYFPAVFGQNRLSTIDINFSIQKFDQLRKEFNTKQQETLSNEQLALGFIKIANEKMAQAIKEISVSRGYDVRKYALVCFGGAGAQHACEIASILGIRKIIIHPLAGIMSAYGIGLARPSYTTSTSVLNTFNSNIYSDLLSTYTKMEENLINTENIKIGSYSIKREIDIRPKGTESYLTLNYSVYSITLTEFNNKYKQLFSINTEDIQLEVVNIRSYIELDEIIFNKYIAGSDNINTGKQPLFYKEIYYPDGIRNVPVYVREMIDKDTVICGPAIIADKHFTVIVDPLFSAAISESGIIVIDKVTDANRVYDENPERLDPVLLEVFNNLFSGIANEMGHVLRNTSHSVNIKERLDFSCAIFDRNGDLVANAHHIPVHLGSMSETIKGILGDNKDKIKPGDVFLTNNPYKGGSHLPDLTIVAPVFGNNNDLLFFTAARGHHADIGGKSPGSIPAFINHLEDEGVVIDNFPIVQNGNFKEEELKKLLTNNKYPVRSLKERIFDLKAQIAACQKGEMELKSLIEKYSWPVVNRYMHFISQNAEFYVKQALYKFLGDRNSIENQFEDRLDDGSLIKVSVRIEVGKNPPETVKATIDFSGTTSQHSNDNLNAPVSVTQAAILYAIRCLVAEDIPLNSGCLKPIKVILPENCLINSSYPVPVASGNVETSQRIVDVLLGAFKAAAASQGTMNNFLFQVEGDSPYYETIAGGSGATAASNGASAIQVHMTNTRITDPEVLEFRHPDVLVEQFNIRKGSGGKGKFSGGDGVIREIRFLKPADISIISERRVFEPYGMEGGNPGKAGMNSFRSSDGIITILPHRTEIRVNKNDSIVIETPGGGGWGSG